MTEYELADLISTYGVQGGTFLTMWLTILSAYALVSYVAGKDLTTFQVLWLNTLYLFASSLAMFSFKASTDTQVFYAKMIRELHPHSPQAMNEVVQMSAIAIASVGTLVTLLFMWQIRHSKSG
jgi:magnesium-transporting ATPase (P-type)